MTARATTTATAGQQTSRTAVADPLGPDSLTWKYFGDLRTGMLGVWICAMQNLYPELGESIKGTDSQGRRYHALNPETFYWAHATIFMLIIKTAEYRATLDVFTIRIQKPWFVAMPTAVWDQLFKPMVASQRWIAAGLFDSAVREKAGMRWTQGDEVARSPIDTPLVEAPGFMGPPRDRRTLRGPRPKSLIDHPGKAA